MLGFKNLKIPTKKPGDPLYAAEFNMLVKAVAARLQSAPLGIVSPLGTFLHRQWQNRIEPDVILVKNTSEETIPEFGILGLEDPVALPGSDLPEFKSRIVMEGAIPALASHVGKVAVAIYAIAPDETGPCYVSGYCQVQIDVTDAAHTTAEVKDGEHLELESKIDGTIPIVWKESGTGTKWAVIKLGGGAAPSPRPWRALITARSGALNATYDAEAIDDASITVSGATPINQLKIKDVDTVAAEVDDECYIDDFGSGYVLITLTEYADSAACP